MAAAMTVLTVAFTSCEPKGDEPTPPPADNELVGSIKDTKVLDASVEYTITGPVIVEEGGVLDIPAGTVIKARKVSAATSSCCKAAKSSCAARKKLPCA